MEPVVKYGETEAQRTETVCPDPVNMGGGKWVLTLGLPFFFLCPWDSSAAAKSAWLPCPLHLQKQSTVWYCVALCGSNGILYLLVGFAILTEQLLCLDGMDP